MRNWIHQSNLLFVTYYPLVLAAAFLVTFVLTPIPAKGLFFLRAMTALVVAVFLAHINRIFELWPAHLLFPSGHTTFCAGLAWSMALLRPWTLVVTVPLVVAMGVGLVMLGSHSRFDVLGAIPLVLVIYGTIHTGWKLPGDFWLKEA